MSIFYDCVEAGADKIKIHGARRYVKGHFPTLIDVPPQANELFSDSG